MSPTEHLDWFEDNIDWFRHLPVDRLADDVPSCPCWDVGHVIGHLAFGLGLAYPLALDARPEAGEAEVWADVARPSELPTGADLLDAFDHHLGRCLAIYRATDPDVRCWTYAGPGSVRFWFRRAAIETTLHRMDVAHGLGLAPAPVDAERMTDAVAEAVEFALPLAATMTDEPEQAVLVGISNGGPDLILGSGRPAAEIRGDAESVLAALWGRATHRVRVTGDRRVAEAWTGLIETAFAGR